MSIIFHTSDALVFFLFCCKECHRSGKSSCVFCFLCLALFWGYSFYRWKEKAAVYSHFYVLLRPLILPSNLTWKPNTPWHLLRQKFTFSELNPLQVTAPKYYFSHHISVSALSVCPIFVLTQEFKDKYSCMGFFRPLCDSILIVAFVHVMLMVF